VIARCGAIKIEESHTRKGAPDASKRKHDLRLATVSVPNRRDVSRSRTESAARDGRKGWIRSPSCR
jgi:hypothetical protein